MAKMYATPTPVAWLSVSPRGPYSLLVVESPHIYVCLARLTLALTNAESHLNDARKWEDVASKYSPASIIWYVILHRRPFQFVRRFDTIYALPVDDLTSDVQEVTLWDVLHYNTVVEFVRPMSIVRPICLDTYKTEQFDSGKCQRRFDESEVETL